MKKSPDTNVIAGSVWCNRLVENQQGFYSTAPADKQKRLKEEILQLIIPIDKSIKRFEYM